MKLPEQSPGSSGRDGKAYLAFGSEICVGVSVPTSSSSEEDMAAALKLFTGSEADASSSASSCTDEGLTFAWAVEEYGRKKSLEHGTLKEYRTTVRKLAEWSAIKSISDSAKEHRSRTPMHFRDINREVLADFLEWVYQQAEKDGNPGRTHNKSREHMRAVLQWLVEVDRLDAMPKLPEKRAQKTAAGLFFLSDDELESLYWACMKMQKPRGWKSPKTIAMYWQAALSIFVTYGVDTQLIFRVDKRADPLRWRNVYGPGLAPDRSSKQECPHGWLAWSRQKTGRQFCAPMTDVVAAHLQAIRPANCDPDSAIFERAGGGRPCERFQELVAIAKIAGKIDTLTQKPVSWTLKDLRKTCATRHDENIPGSSSVVLGHAGDGIADVTRTHYRNPAPLLFKAISTISYPRAFRSVLDDTIKPPDSFLFAK